MKLEITKDFIFIFDLDDTLYNEIDFLISGYNSIIKKLPFNLRKTTLTEMLKIFKNGGDAFDYIISKYNEYYEDKLELLLTYRNHFPDIKLFLGVEELLKELKENNIKIGLITDGRSITQRNKLKSLCIENYFCDIIISEESGFEKPSINNYLFFEKKYKNHNFIYLADNIQKDFLVPNQLGWESICLLDNGNNITKQNFVLPKAYQPNKIIKSFLELAITYET